jgi:hypothetical protein
MRCEEVRSPWLPRSIIVSDDRDRVINTQVLLVTSPHSPGRQLFVAVVIAACIAVSCHVRLFPYSSHTDFVQAESVTMLLRSLGSMDDNKIWALTAVSFCLAPREDPVITMPSDFRSRY